MSKISSGLVLVALLLVNAAPTAAEDVVGSLADRDLEFPRADGLAVCLKSVDGQWQGPAENGQQILACGQIPELDLAVRGPRQQCAAIGPESQAANGGAVAFQQPLVGERRYHVIHRELPSSPSPGIPGEGRVRAP